MARQSKGITLPIIYKADTKGLDDAQSGLEKFGRAAGRIALAAGAALGGIAVSGLKMATDLQTTFAQIEGLVGVSGQQLDELREAAKRLGPEYGKSAQEAADALFFITSAGLRGADAVGVLEAALKGSAIGLGDVNALANAATAAMNTYGPSVLSGADAVDALAEAVRLGQFAPEELAGALGRLVPLSNELGVSFQETAGLIAGLTRGGLNASEAVTGVRGAMQAFLKPTAEAQRMLEQFGMSTDSVRESIRTKGFLATIIDMRAAFGDNEDAITRVFGSIEGLNAALALTGEQQATNIDIIKQMTDEVGVLDEAFGVVEETVGFKAKQAFEQLKNVLLEVGDALLPAVSEAFTNAAPKIQEFTDAAIEFVNTDLKTFIDDLTANEDFQGFLTDMEQTFRDMVPQIFSSAQEVAILAANLTDLLQPAIENMIGEDGALSGMNRILGEINFWLGELNEIELPGATEQTTGFGDAIRLMLEPGAMLAKTLNDIADALDAIRRAYERLMRSGFNWQMQGGTGGVGDAGRQRTGGGARATGGSVSSGLSYLVGERGPEMFVPRTAGTIVPTHRLGGGGSNINITVNAGIGTNGAQVGEQIVAAIKRYERVSGRVFASA